MMVDVYLKAIDGVDNVMISVDEQISTVELDDQLRSRLPLLVSQKSIISESKGTPITKYMYVSELVNDNENEGSDYINLHLRIPICGGKGGFGNSLKTQGGKMRNGKTDKGNYKTLDGVKVKTIRQLQKIDQHMKSLPELEKLKLQKKRDKLQKILDMDTKRVAQSDAKYDDEKYIDELEKTMDDIRAAVFGDDEDDDEEEEEEDDDDDDDDNDEPRAGSSGDSDSEEEDKAHNIASRKARLDSFFK